MTTKQQRIEEALDVLGQLGMPNEQLNDRTAICLLALLDLPETTVWNKASNPMLAFAPSLTSPVKNSNTITPKTRGKVSENIASNSLLPQGYCCTTRTNQIGRSTAPTTAIKWNPMPLPCSANLAQGVGKKPCSLIWKHARRWQTNSPGTATCKESR